jgi:hypothetical protein
MSDPKIFQRGTTMSTRPTTQAALLLFLLAPAAASAQSTSTARGYQSTYSTRPTLVLFANGGGNSSLTDLNDAGTASLGTSWTAGGGLGVQLNRYTAEPAPSLRGAGDGKGDPAETVTPVTMGLVLLCFEGKRDNQRGDDYFGKGPSKEGHATPRRS